MKTVIVVLAMCLVSFAQNAKVIALSEKDATKSKQLHEAALAAQKAVEEFDKEVDKRYTAESANHKKGWESGFEYSEDWQFIVPKAFGYSAITGTLANVPDCGCSLGSCFTTSPTTGWSVPGVHAIPYSGIN